MAGRSPSATQDVSTVAVPEAYLTDGRRLMRVLESDSHKALLEDQATYTRLEVRDHELRAI